MKDFSEFCDECAKSGFAHQLAAQTSGLTPEQAVASFQIALQIVRKYHEWLQQDHQ